MPEPQEESSLNELAGRLLGQIDRRRWSILTVTCGTTLAGIAVLLLLPNRYTSSATLLVVQQQVPQRYVVPNSTTDLTAALQAIKQEVLSRTRLLKMINDFGLYPKYRDRLAPEELVGLMSSSIDIDFLGGQAQQKDFDAFKISFTAENAHLAQQVTSTLTSLFINENLRTREEQATNTTRFLHEQVETKKKTLEEQEQRLKEFKLKYVGELPEQQQGNLGVLTGLYAQLQNTVTGLSRAQQQRVYLESLLGSSRHLPAPAGAGVAVPPNPGRGRVLSPLELAENELARLESARAVLQGKNTAEHPDVLRIQREIASAEEALKRLQAAAPLGEKDDKPDAPAPAGRRTAVATETGMDPAVAQLKSQLEANRIEIENLSKDEKQLKAAIAQYENRLNQTPVREQQQSGIVRDTEALRQEYADLQKKEQESQLATNLEKQQGGQQFRLIDPASFPAVPSSPKRLKMSLAGGVVGLLLGVGLAFLMEARDTSFHNEQELGRQIATPFVLGIPVLATQKEERRHMWKCAAEWLAGCVLVLLVLIAEFYVYKRG